MDAVQDTTSPDAYVDFLKRADEALVPLTVVWEITNACNLRCVHCYQADHEARAELSREEAVRLLDQLADEGVLYLVLTGGEPLLRPDLFDIAAEARRREFALRLFTNGTLVGPGEADRIAELAPLSVDISLYGACAATHDAITAFPGSYERAVRAVSLLRARGVRTSVKMIVMKANVHEFDRVREWAAAEADRFVYDVQVIPRRDGASGPTALQLDEDALTGFFRAHASPADETTCDLPGDEQSGLLNGAPCGAARTGAAIAGDGTVTPCVALPLVAGNVREQAFGDIWRNAPVFREMRRIRVRDLHGCRKCGMITYCRRCPGAAHLETRDHRARSMAACLTARARLRAAGGRR